MDCLLEAFKSMMNLVENKLVCDMKDFCFLCKADSVLENPKDGKEFYHCTSCGIDVLCNVAIARQFDKNTKKLTEKCPKCRGKIVVFQFPLNNEELAMLKS
jgi:hypothetical protein